MKSPLMQTPLSVITTQERIYVHLYIYVRTRILKLNILMKHMHTSVVEKMIGYISVVVAFVEASLNN